MAESQPKFDVLQLQFGHDCRNVGCNVHGCQLCRNNIKRRCTAHFREKYIDNVNRVFTAQCEAPIQITLIDAETGHEYIRTDENQYRLDGFQVQLCLLEGVAFDQKEAEVGTENVSDEDLNGMMLLDNTNASKPEPLLLPGKNAVGEHTVDHKLLIPLQVGTTFVLCRTSRSSQSAQGGRTRPFRMLAKAVDSDGAPISWIKHAVSDPFVVTTRRTQGAEKAVIPCEDDPVNKLPGVGKETHAKLKNLQAAGLDYPLPNYHITRVKDLFRIIDKADDHLLSELGRVLGLTTMKLQELQQSARTMARADTRRRVWGHPDFPNIRLLYPCEAGAPLMGAQDIEIVVDGEDQSVFIHSTTDLGEAEVEHMNLMRLHAQNQWWDEGHPGWGIWNEQDEGEDEQPPIVPDAVPVDSLRHQMDRQCKQRRVNYSEMDNGYEIRPDGSGPYSESTMRASSGGMRANSGGYRTNSGALSDAYSGRTHSYTMPKQEQYTMPPYEFAVQAQDGCLKAPESVFSDGARQSSDMLETASRDTYPEMAQAAEQFYNSNSNDILLEQPAGLAGFAYITSGPGMETAGPIRFKRSVSGTRYKPMPEHGAYEQHMPTIVDSGSAELYGDLNFYNQPRLPPLPSNFPQLNLFSNPGSGAGLPPRMSRELRTQTSFEKLQRDPVASWKQNRLSSAASFGKYFSQDFMQNIWNSQSYGLGEDGIKGVLSGQYGNEGVNTQYAQNPSAI